MQTNFTPTVLTIAGSDPYGGAGIQVDAKVIHALGGYAFCVTTALTAQNSLGVQDVLPTSSEHFKVQLYTLLEDIKVDAIKIGMLANTEIIEVVVEAIKRFRLTNIVLDPVWVSSSGKALLEPSAIEYMVRVLFPLVDIVTPNIPEVNRLLGTAYTGRKEEIEMMAQGLFTLGVKAVLIKGGHSYNQESAIDYLVEKRCQPVVFKTKRLHTTHTHGTGCVLSSAIASALAKRENLERSVHIAKDFLYQKLHTSSKITFNYHDESLIRKEPFV